MLGDTPAYHSGPPGVIATSDSHNCPPRAAPLNLANHTAVAYEAQEETAGQEGGCRGVRATPLPARIPAQNFSYLRKASNLQNMFAFK